MKEYWQLVVGYPAYEVSNLGRVRSLYCISPYSTTNLRKIPLVMKFNLNPKTGYLSVSLGHRDKKPFKKLILVHRIVALSFIKNPENKPHVNHKNGIKSDNRAANLEWCTRNENMRHLYDVLGMKSPACREVINRKTGKVYNTISEAAASIGMKLTTFSCQLSGQNRNQTNFDYYD